MNSFKCTLWVKGPSPFLREYLREKYAMRIFTFLEAFTRILNLYVSNLGTLKPQGGEKKYKYLNKQQQCSGGGNNLVTDNVNFVLHQWRCTFNVQCKTGGHFSKQTHILNALESRMHPTAGSSWIRLWQVWPCHFKVWTDKEHRRSLMQLTLTWCMHQWQGLFFCYDAGYGGYVTELDIFSKIVIFF